MPVAFNTDRARAAASCRGLAGLDADIACFGHGEPVSRDATAHLQAAARQLICKRLRGSRRSQTARSQQAVIENTHYLNTQTHQSRRDSVPN
jgi:hypothetical protein